MSTQPTDSLLVDSEVSAHDDAFTEAPEQDRSGKSNSRGRLLLRRFFRNRMAVVGLVFFIGLFVFAFVGPHFTKWSYKDLDFENFRTGPSSTHYFGTDQAGQDVYAQTLRGMQKSLIIGLLTAVLTTGIAAFVGSAAAYFGGMVDRFLMWIVDLLLVIPSFLIIAILSPSFRGKTWLIFVVLLAVFSWMITARAIRSMTLSLREREYVTAARYMGVNPMTIIGRHVLPNIASYLIVDVTLNVGGAILGEASLSFFGFGIQAPDVSLGTLLSAGQASATTYPWLFGFCGGLLVLIILSVNFIGDGLRDAFDPNSNSSRAR